MSKSKSSNGWMYYPSSNNNKHIQISRNLYTSPQWQAIKPLSKLVLQAIQTKAFDKDGYGTERITCTYADIKAYSGIKNNVTIKNCLQELEAYGFIETVASGGLNAGGGRVPAKYRLSKKWQTMSIKKAKAELKKEQVKKAKAELKKEQVKNG